MTLKMMDGTESKQSYLVVAEFGNHRVGLQPLIKTFATGEVVIGSVLRVAPITGKLDPKDADKLTPMLKFQKADENRFSTVLVNQQVCSIKDDPEALYKTLAEPYAVMLGKIFGEGLILKRKAIAQYIFEQVMNAVDQEVTKQLGNEPVFKPSGE